MNKSINAVDSQEMLEELAGRLRALSVKRVNIDDARRCFYDLNPELLDHPDRNSHFLFMLEQLADAEVISFPSKNKKNWDINSRHRLPRWILLTGTAAQPTIDAFSIAWVEELSFCTRLKNRSQLESAILINDFLINNRNSLQPLLPIRERSLEIFGDEKRLDNLVSNGSLFGERLPLSLLGAFAIAPPIPFESSGLPNLRVLVVENHNTYWSMCRYNEHAKKYSAVAWGGGNTVIKHAQGIEQLVRSAKATGVDYFGDIDIRGIEILHDFLDILSCRHGIDAQPAHGFYEWLLKYGRRRAVKQSSARRALDKLTNSFSAEVSTQISDLLTKSLRIPQESLNSRILSGF